MFKDRAEAGRRLASRLLHLRAQNPVVFAVPRGGVVVGYEVARALEAPLDVIVARKLGSPGDPELAVGAVAEGDGPQSVINEGLVRSLAVSPDYLRRVAAEQLLEVERRQKAYRAGREPAPAQGRSIILVDDGVATGASVLAALRGLRRRAPARVVLAVPVASPDVAAVLRSEADEWVCLEEPEPFVSVGTHYLHFDQTSDEEVVGLLEAARPKK